MVARTSAEAIAEIITSRGISDETVFSHIPDCSFVRNERLPGVDDFTRLKDGAPDLAIEVVSPTNEAEDLLERVDHYLQYGGEEVWSLYPAHKRVHCYRRDYLKNVRVYYAEDTLDAAPVLPGLQIKVSDLFVLRRT